MSVLDGPIPAQLAESNGALARVWKAIETRGSTADLERAAEASLWILGDLIRLHFESKKTAEPTPPKRVG